jgi:hypothetical protein
MVVFLHLCKIIDSLIRDAIVYSYLLFFIHPNLKNNDLNKVISKYNNLNNLIERISKKFFINYFGIYRFKDFENISTEKKIIKEYYEKEKENNKNMSFKLTFASFSLLFFFAFNSKKILEYIKTHYVKKLKN